LENSPVIRQNSEYAMLQNPLKKRWPEAVALLLVSATLLLYMSMPDDRTYWPFMVIAYWLGIFVYMKEARRLPPGEKPSLLRYLFPKEVWLHRSSINDCILILLNFGMLYVILRYVTIGSNDFETWTKSVLDRLTLGGARSAAPPGIGVIALYTAAAFMLSELFFYFNHRLQHTVPLLWEFHKVHHSAKVMTPLTVNRIHPLTSFFDLISRHLGVGIPSGIFLFLYPEIKSVDIVVTTMAVFSGLNIIGGNLHHSHIWLRFPPAVERFITSPALHQIHHSDRAEHFDRNFGTIITFWDWVFGSLYLPKGREDVTFGLGDAGEDAPYQSVMGLYIHPLKQAAARIWGAKGTPMSAENS
jgi:sterol desaturase/sphingolipid hydroxylase (fatty acid hydroxylase superfamily)